MRGNIDLTEGRDFPERSRRPTDHISRTLFKFFDIPWKLQPVTSDLDFAINDDRLFPTGTKAQIKSRLLTRQACSGDFCDRCGASLKNIPWKNLFGLCNKCDKWLTVEYGRRKPSIPWQERGRIG